MHYYLKMPRRLTLVRYKQNSGIIAALLILFVCVKVGCASKDGNEIESYRHYCRVLRRLRHIHLLARGHDSCGKPCTQFFFRIPDKEIASKVFSSCRGGPVPLSMFNHDCLGMTRPVTTNRTPSLLLLPSDLDAPWWPGTAFASDSDARKSGWRVRRYRSHLGQGLQCYNELKRVILNWEFDTGANRPRQKSMGIIRIRNSIAEGGAAGNGKHHEISLIPGAKRMATYSEANYNVRIGNLTLGFPTFFAVSPVAGVYDIVDGWSDNNDLFTSTSYATVGRHLLCGEERVTAILRNDKKVDLEVLSYSRPAPSLVGKIVWPFIGRMQNQFFESQMKAIRLVASSGCKVGFG